MTRMRHRITDGSPKQSHERATTWRSARTAIALGNREQQADFTTIGSTGSAEGWVPFSHSDTITSSTGQVWVAAGIRVAGETHRDYWIDRVEVSITPIPEPQTALAAAIAGGCAKWFSRRSRRTADVRR